MGVLRRQPFDRIDDEHRNVRAPERPQRPQRRVLLGGRPRGDLAAPADAGGVDQHDLAAAPRQAGVDGVARRPGDVADDRPLLAEQGVEQARLADVRPPDEGDRRRLAVLLRRPSRRPSARLRHPRRSGLAGIVRRRASSASGSPTDDTAPGGRRRPPRPTPRPRPRAPCGRVPPRSPAAAPRRWRPCRSPVPRPCAAEMAYSLLPAQRVELGAFELAPVVVRLVDRDEDRAPSPRRRSSAASASAGGLPGRGIHHEDDDVRLARSRAGPGPGRAPRWDRPGPAPARRCPRRRTAGRSTRRRRTGGRAWSGRGPRRSRCGAPTIRLKSVLLPTFGRPTMATTGIPVRGPATSGGARRELRSA